MRRGDRLPVGRRWLRELVIAVVLTLAIWLTLHLPTPHAALYDQLKGRRNDVYGDLLGVHASLLGFVLAALTVALAYSTSPRMDLLRDRMPTIIEGFVNALRAETLASLASLLALLIDTDAAPTRIAPGMAFAGTIVAIARLTRLLWITEHLARIAAKRARKRPGE